MELRYEQGQTPLDPDELSGLIPKHISTQADLNEWEQLNIAGTLPLMSRRLPRLAVTDILDDVFLRDVHRHMFGKTWEWAGRYRISDKSIGCDWRQVSMKVNQLLGNIEYFIENHTFSSDEIAIRFHHKLVWIHPFPNGNGRHSRMMADLLALKLGQPVFTWGGGDAWSLVVVEELRKRYLHALRTADQVDNFAPLLAFARG